MKRIEFYAALDDVLGVLQAVERVQLLQYVQMGFSDTRKGVRFDSAADLPHLGMADHGSGISCESYLVTTRSVKIRERGIALDDGRHVFALDQLLNPDTVTLTPAGLWGNECVLSGRVATVSDTPLAQKLMRQFDSAFKKSFVRIKAYRVGPQALAFHKDGRRLTSSDQSPRDFDLAIE